MYGHFWGDCNLAGERVEFELETPEEHMGRADAGLGIYAALILLVDSENCMEAVGMNCR